MTGLALAAVCRPIIPGKQLARQDAHSIALIISSSLVIARFAGRRRIAKVTRGRGPPERQARPACQIPKSLHGRKDCRV